jgi:UDP-N-acetylmuramate: L-alanyl-gamma-D-glutamyl-meso-diaminopimelate ligase
MHIHILGICGTFMGGLAVLARAAGHTVTGCDAAVYPPMSTQLAAQGIELIEGYHPDQLKLEPDLYVVGNVVTRGNPLMEAILDQGLPYTSGPQWLSEHLLLDKWVLAVAGTHGKTTTTAMLTWILEEAGLKPSFLLGGVPLNFGVSARLGDSPFFIIEADEYDTAFFDKRSKFVHYRPRTVILNNLEYDHADIFSDLAAIETQFHHLVRIVPNSGRLIVNGQCGKVAAATAPSLAPSAKENIAITETASSVHEAPGEALKRVLDRGCWSEVEYFGVSGAWEYALETSSNNAFAVKWEGHSLGQVQWSPQSGMQGTHNQMNALAAIAAARHCGVPPQQAIEALQHFSGVKRRMEVRGVVRGITVYDDFAHHPTAIQTTLAGLRAQIAHTAASCQDAPYPPRILAVLEPRSNTMKLGIMKSRLLESLADADYIFAYTGAAKDTGHQTVQWDVADTIASLGNTKAQAFHDVPSLVKAVAGMVREGDHILVMSNGGFENVHTLLLEQLQSSAD